MPAANEIALPGSPVLEGTPAPLLSPSHSRHSTPFNIRLGTPSHRTPFIPRVLAKNSFTSPTNHSVRTIADKDKIVGKEMFHEWSRMIGATLASAGGLVLRVTTEETVCPAFGVEGYNAWHDCNDSGRNISILNIDRTINHLLDGILSAHECWIVLRTQFAPSDTLSIARNVGRLMTMQFTSATSEGLDDFAREYRELQRLLADVGQAYSDENSVSHVLQLLPISLAHVRSSTFSSAVSTGNFPTFDNLISIMRAEIMSSKPMEANMAQAGTPKLAKRKSGRIDFSKPCD